MYEQTALYHAYRSDRPARLRHGRRRICHPGHPGQPCLSETAARDCQQGAIRPSAEENSGQGKPANPAEYDAAAAPMPEPQTFLMMLIGLVLLGFTSKRRASEKFSD